MELLLATTNRGKAAELRQLLADVPASVLSLGEFAKVPVIEETGATFEENAVLKAAGYARQTELWTLADDSGLEVTALGGRPGVASARFAGEGTGYDVKISKLLRLINEARNADRSARFICVMAIADADGKIRVIAHGECRGRIAEAPRGENGFGYDPIFIPDGYDQTFGELTDEVKSSISHRARAAREIVRYLLDFIVV